MLNIRISKTDPNAQGLKCFISHSDKEYGPHKWVPIYKRLSDISDSNSFLFPNVTTQSISNALKRKLKYVYNGNIDINNYSSHSFRKGGATEAARNGIQDSVIKRHGRWNSTCFMVYTMVERRNAGETITTII